MNDEVTSRGARTLVGRWFQSYNYVSFTERHEGDSEWAVGKTGRVVTLLEPGLYLIAFDDDPGEVTIGVRNFDHWRFFPTKAALSAFISPKTAAAVRGN